MIDGRTKFRVLCFSGPSHRVSSSMTTICLFVRAINNFKSILRGIFFGKHTSRDTLRGYSSERYLRKFLRGDSSGWTLLGGFFKGGFEGALSGGSLGAYLRGLFVEGGSRLIPAALRGPVRLLGPNRVISCMKRDTPESFWPYGPVIEFANHRLNMSLFSGCSGRCWGNAHRYTTAVLIRHSRILMRCPMGKL